LRDIRRLFNAEHSGKLHANTSAAFCDQGGVENVMAANLLITVVFCVMRYSCGGNAHEQWWFSMWWGLGSFCSTIELHPRVPHFTRVSAVFANWKNVGWRGLHMSSAVQRYEFFILK